MTPQSARSTMWVSLALLLVSGMIGAPEAGVAGAILAGCCALAAVVYGTRGTRVASALILVASVGLSIALFPAAREDTSKYRDRGAQPTPGAAAPGPAGAR